MRSRDKPDVPDTLGTPVVAADARAASVQVLHPLPEPQPHSPSARGLELPAREIATTDATISTVATSGTGRPVLLLHGNSSCKEIWVHQIDCIAGFGRPVLALDLPGHGCSSDAKTPEKTYSFPGYASVVSEVLDATGCDGVDLVGWSLGGHIALELCARDSRVKSVLTVGAPPVRPCPEALDLAFHATPTMRLAGKETFSPSEVKAYAAEMIGGRAPVAEQLLEAVRRTDPKARHWMFTNAMQGVGVDQRSVIAGNGHRFCVVHGTRDPFVRGDYLQSLAVRRLRNLQLVFLRGAGHAPHYRMPRSFNQILESFLGLRGRPVASSKGGVEGRGTADGEAEREIA